MRWTVLLMLAVATTAPAQTAWLDRLDDALAWRSPGGVVGARLSGLVDLEGWYIDQRPPGLVFGDGESFVNPRLTLFLDAWLGKQLYGFVQTRVDRGFDRARLPAPTRAWTSTCSAGRRSPTRGSVSKSASTPR